MSGADLLQQNKYRSLPNSRMDLGAGHAANHSPSWRYVRAKNNGVVLGSLLPEPAIIR